MNACGVVYLVDDDDSLRAALSSLIRSLGISVREFPSARDFLASARADEPACLVLDVRLPDLSGLDLQRRLRDTGDALPVIFITGHGDIPMSVKAMKLGAMEFLVKPFREQELLDAICLGLEKDADRRQRLAVKVDIQSRWLSLTPRERQVAARILTGQLNKQVAADLGLSEITVKIHRRNVLRKMQVSSLVALAQLVARLKEPNGNELNGW